MDTYTVHAAGLLMCRKLGTTVPTAPELLQPDYELLAAVRERDADEAETFF